jgi:predicted ATPase/DNA-binding winged helix-turn-helix (wHTH) protein
MHSGSDARARTGIAFGRFRVLPHNRELFADDRPVRLGGRAFDVLMALIEARGTVLSKQTLIARVWPDRVVEENNLQAQISALRSAFGADRDKIQTVPGRGYQFVGEIRVEPARPGEPVGTVAARPTTVQPPTNVPEPVSELIGRDEELGDILNLVAAHRLVTLTGAGGIGKTRLASAAARELLPHFADGVWLAEFSPIADPGLVPATVAAAAGLEIGTGELSARRVAQALAGRRLMLVLDTCEHVIVAAAAMAEALLRADPVVRVIATSREPLNAEGEWTYAVPPLAVPTADAVDQDDQLRYGAVLLFLERARAAEPHLAADKHAAPAIAAICRRLDGIPLAIELAAARAATLGISQVAALLDDRFHLLSGGRRTALPRHRTLRATLDWSHDLLFEAERRTLRRLAVFAGAFDLEMAAAVAAGAEFGPSEIVDCLVNLISKSLVVAALNSKRAPYRLLDTMRAYALEQLRESAERQAVAQRHAEYFRELFEKAEAERAVRTAAEWLSDYAGQLDNLRAALDWAFSPDGDAAVGVALTVAAVPMWMQLSLLEESRGRAEQALTAVGSGTSWDARLEMKLQSALGFALMFTTGMTENAHAALVKAVELSEALGDLDYQLRSLFGLCVFRLRLPDFRSALTLARRCAAIADRVDDPIAKPTANWMLGLTLFCLGDSASGQAHMEQVRDGYRPSSRQAEVVRFGFDQRVYALGILGLTYWIRGFPERATAESLASTSEAQALEHPVSLCIALWTGSLLSLWLGDLAALDRSTRELLAHTEKYSLNNYHAYGLGFAGELAIAKGERGGGIRLLRDCLDGLRAARHQVFYSVFLALLAKRIGENGNPTEALTLIEDALHRAELADELWYMPELLRIKGDLLRDARSGLAEPEDFLLRSLALAQQQGALSWALRAAASLAWLRHDQGRATESVSLLQSVYCQFSEGFNTADLKAAKVLLDDRRPVSS